MDRTGLLWTITVFFGSAVAFGLIRNATEGESVAVSIGLQAVAGLVMVAAIVYVVGRRS